MHLPIGFSLQNGKYIVEKVLGQGGFGITYLASHPGSLLMDKVAIKEFFPGDYCARDERGQVHITTGVSKDDINAFREKFKKEAMNLYKLSHDNIVKVTDLFEENGTVYYVMEHIEGNSLHSFVSQNGALNEAEALRVTRQIAQALAYLHSKKMMHLDVKPGNIMIRENSHDALLIDFGLAKRYSSAGVATSSSPIGISAGFAPLEQYSAASIGTFTPETDIYSLGATLYFMLTGNAPAAAVDRAINPALEFPAKVSPAARRAIEAAMQIDAKLRPASISHFLALLDEPAKSGKKTVITSSSESKDATRPLNAPKEKQKSKPNRTYLIANTIIGLIFLCLFLFAEQLRYDKSYTCSAELLLDWGKFPDSSSLNALLNLIAILAVILLPFFYRTTLGRILCTIFSILCIVAFVSLGTVVMHPIDPLFTLTFIVGFALFIVNLIQTIKQLRKSRKSKKLYIQ